MGFRGRDCPEWPHLNAGVFLPMIIWTVQSVQAAAGLSIAFAGTPAIVRPDQPPARNPVEVVPC